MSDATVRSLKDHANNIERGASPSNPTLVKRLRKAADRIDQLTADLAASRAECERLREGVAKCISLYEFHLGSDLTRTATGGNRYYEIHYNDWHDAIEPLAKLLKEQP